jgi:hypothetical protein
MEYHSGDGIYHLTDRDQLELRIEFNSIHLCSSLSCCRLPKTNDNFENKLILQLIDFLAETVGLNCRWAILNCLCFPLMIVFVCE